MRERGRFEGALLIVRFNWPLYAAALGVIVGSASVIALTGIVFLKITALLACACASWFLVGSLLSSHLVYDRSDLHRGRWLIRACPAPPARVAICHCGYDEISALVRECLPDASLKIFDHYDEATMSEPSIRRARRRQNATGFQSARHSAWSSGEGEFDIVLGVLAIHELRSHPARAAWFCEARRCLSIGGHIVLVEHLRDFANFIAFGPGFLHFHSAATWRRAWESAGLRCEDTFHITPFVRVFILTRHD